MCQAEQDFCAKFFGLGSDTDFMVSDGWISKMKHTVCYRGRFVQNTVQSGHAGDFVSQKFELWKTKFESDNMLQIFDVTGIYKFIISLFRKLCLVKRVEEQLFRTLTKFVHTWDKKRFEFQRRQHLHMDELLSPFGGIPTLRHLCSIQTFFFRVFQMFLWKQVGLWKNLQTTHIF